MHKRFVPCLRTSVLNIIIFFLFQTLLRTKDNEVVILKKEISCLQSEVQSLTKVYRTFFQIYFAVYYSQIYFRLPSALKIYLKFPFPCFRKEKEHISNTMQSVLNLAT